MNTTRQATWRITLVGLGIIGSQSAAHVARINGVRQILLVDKDYFDETNVSSQDITCQDVGQPKAVVVGRKLRQINPHVDVVTIVGAVEDIPLTSLRSSVLLGGLDSRKARRYVSEAAWRLGSVYIDAGVEPDGLLARVNVYTPGPDNPCYQCGWSQSDYEGLEQQQYPCLGGSAKQPATGGWSALGALAASLQVIECQKLLGGEPGQVLDGHELLVNARWPKHVVTRCLRNPECRFPHEVWRIEETGRAPGELSLAEAFALALPDHRARGSLDIQRRVRDRDLSLRVQGKPFVRLLRCQKCPNTHDVLRLAHRLHLSQYVCEQCKRQEMAAFGFDMSDHLAARGLPDAVLSRKLDSFGLEPGDVFTIRGASSAERHFEVGGVPGPD